MAVSLRKPGWNVLVESDLFGCQVSSWSVWPDLESRWRLSSGHVCKGGLTRDRRSTLSLGGTNQLMDWGPGMGQRTEEKLSWAPQFTFSLLTWRCPVNAVSCACWQPVSSLPTMPFLLWWSWNKLLLKVGFVSDFCHNSNSNEECNHWRLHDRAFLICFSSCYYRPSEIVQKTPQGQKPLPCPLGKDLEGAIMILCPGVIR